MNTARRPIKVLVVEDERIVAHNLRERLIKLGYDVPAIAPSGEQALLLAHENKPDLVLMDIRIEGRMDGIDTAILLGTQLSMPVIYLTAHAEDNTLERARQTHPYGYLVKPFSERELHATIQMAMERRRIELNLQISEERLHLALEGAQLGVCHIDEESGEVTLDDRSARLFALSGNQEVTSLAELARCVQDEGRSKLLHAFDLCEETGSSTFELEIEGGATQYRWLRLHAKLIPPEAFGTRRMIFIIQDITSEKQWLDRVLRLNADLERRVALRTTELAASNAALEMFSSSLAHDLQAPVRTVGGFSQALREFIAVGDRDQSLRLLDRIELAAIHLGAMIEAVLKLSRSINAPLVLQHVDLAELATLVDAQLREEFPGRQVEFIVAPDIWVHADPSLIRQVLENLLRNAWKYTSRRRIARIEMGVEQFGEETAIFVRDNGSGFDPAHVGELFKPFKRLHTEQEFPGMGIGLSTVRRIIERHGGNVWATAQVDDGATFHFTVGRPSVTYGLN